MITLKNSPGTILSLILGLFFIGLGIYFGAKNVSGTQEASQYVITAVAVLVIGALYAIVRYRNMKK